MKLLKTSKNILLIAVLCGGAVNLTNCGAANNATSADDVNKAVVINNNPANTVVENANGKPPEIVAGNINQSIAGTNKTDKNPVRNDNAKTSASSVGKLGVPECDEYIAKYEMCLTKIPEPRRESYRKTLEMTRTGLKTAVANPPAKAVIGISCKASLETAKETMKEFSCDW